MSVLFDKTIGPFIPKTKLLQDIKEKGLLSYRKYSISLNNYFIDEQCSLRIVISVHPDLSLNINY